MIDKCHLYQRSVYFFFSLRKYLSFLFSALLLKEKGIPLFIKRSNASMPVASNEFDASDDGRWNYDDFNNYMWSDEKNWIANNSKRQRLY